MNTKAALKAIALTLVTLLMLGCATTTKTTHSGYLDNYQALKPLANYPGTSAYKAQGFNDDYLKQVQKVHIQPFEVWLDEANLKGINLEQMAELTRYFQQELKQQLSPHYQIVERIDAETLVIQGAFTKAKTQAPEVNAADILPFRIVMNAGNIAYLTATGQKDVVTEVGIEVKFNQGNLLLFAMTANKELDLTVVDDKAGNSEAVKQVLAQWAKNFSRHINFIKG